MQVKSSKCSSQTDSDKDVCKTCISGYFDGDKKKSCRKSHRFDRAWFTWLMVLYSCGNKVDTFCAELVEAGGVWPFIWKADKRKTVMKLLATLHMEAKQWSGRSSNFRQKSLSLLLMIIEWSHQWETIQTVVALSKTIWIQFRKAFTWNNHHW